jgi:hypothetical protein
MAQTWQPSCTGQACNFGKAILSFLRLYRLNAFVSTKKTGMGTAWQYRAPSAAEA